MLDDGTYRIVKAGQLILISPMEFITVNNKPSTNSDYKALCISYPDIDKLVVCQNTLEAPVASSYQLVNSLPEELNNLIVNLENVLSSYSIPEAIKYHKAIEPLIWLQSIGINFHFQSKNSLYSGVKALIESDLSYRWQVADIAKKFYYSDTTFKRKLKSIGTSFTTILLNTRLEHGLLLLQTSHRTVAQISLDCGFSTPSHFSAAFKKRFLIMPKEIRSLE